ncbi:glycosyltransferase family 4 protein [Pedobacter gandavensis]|uniref:glycosyltransferase family 4 protein n=1 Tax=Pedobacter gandavensis TaxID=2679963 RepID=UPI00292CE4FC|nr:glycosyltransferase family 4 protein [Pedobacter gandavensis]
MKKINKAVLLNDYNKFAEKAAVLVRNNDLKNALVYIETCVKIAYNFNFIYTDDKLESLLMQISEKTLSKPEFIPIKDRYVFYDYFGNTKVLTQQYIRALISWDVEFLYLLQDGTNFSKEIRDELASYPKAKVVVLTEDDVFNKMRQAQLEIAEFRPSKALLHIAPWDLIGICVWNSFTNVDRFLINLTDHAFWLGKSCSDFILEFRSYGYNLSHDARNIPKDKLLLQAYYPIQNDVPFKGFPIDLKDKIIGFSGSSFYKIYGRNGKFLDLIKSILDRNENFIFLLAGWGIDEPIRKFIEDNNFKDRFILLGERNDIDQVFKHIDIFINTYPFIGGLMTQLAVVNKKAIVSYTSEDLTFNLIEDFLSIDRDRAGSIMDECAFLDEVDQLIKSSTYRDENIELYSGSIPSIQEFNNTLWENCNQPHNSCTLKIPSIVINYDAILELYLEVDNDFLKLYQKLKLVNLKSLYFRHFPFSALKCAALIVFNDFKTVKRNIKDYIKN